MSTQQEKQAQDDKDLERAVVRYLRNHPDFFEQRLDLLADMRLHHEHAGTVSLIERQVSVLREQKEEARSKLQQLIKNAQKNEILNQKLDSLVLAFLDAESFEEVLQVVQHRIKQDFDADMVVLRLFKTDHAAMQAHPDLIDWSEPALGAFEKVIEGRKPICGSLKPGQLDALFSEQSDIVGSAALIPLIESSESKKCYGLLAIGSHDKLRFRVDLGILFLSHLGKVLTRVLKMHLS